MFPGVVTRRRRSSVARSGSFSLNDPAMPPAADGATTGMHRKAGWDEVIEETEREKSGAGTPREAENDANK